MRMRFIPRLLVVSLMLAFVVAGLNRYSAGAAERIDWTETKSQEDVVVQSCDGFDITSNYTADIAHHLIADNNHDEVLERLNVDFAGSLGHSVTGKSYAYDGKFTRWSDYDRGKVTITDLELRFEVNMPGQFTVAIDRIEMDLVADPAEVIKQFVPNALNMELCYLLADNLNWNVAPVGAPTWIEAEVSVPQSITAAVHTENSALDNGAGEANDDTTPWTELDPCDTSPPGRPC